MVANIIQVIGYLAIIIIFGLLLHFLIIYLKKMRKNRDMRKKKREKWPPDEYMNNVGRFCPDYWDLLSRNKDHHTCINRFNIPVKNREDIRCYDKTDDGYLNTKTFKTLEWPINFEDHKNTFIKSDACKWIKNCGPVNNKYGSWLGLDEHC